MTHYSDIETPINDFYDPFLDQDWEMWDYDDPNLQIRQRMMLILGAVTVLVIAFALVVVPKWVGMGGIAEEYENATAVAIDDQTITKNNLNIKQTESSAATLIAGPISSIFTPEVQHWAPQIAVWSVEHNLDPNIIATIMQIESCGNPQAVSIAGAQGLFQVMPFHFSGGESMQDPDTNARRGMNFYNEQLRYTSGDIYLSFAGYNGGYAASGGNYANWPNETQRYHKWAQGIYDDAKAGRESSPTLQEWLAAGGAPGCQIAANQLGLN